MGKKKKKNSLYGVLCYQHPGESLKKIVREGESKGIFSGGSSACFGSNWTGIYKEGIWRRRFKGKMLEAGGWRKGGEATWGCFRSGETGCMLAPHSSIFSLQDGLSMQWGKYTDPKGSPVSYHMHQDQVRKSR